MHPGSVSTPRRSSKSSDFSPDLFDLPTRAFCRAAVVDDEIGKPALLVDRHLRRKHSLGSFTGNAPTHETPQLQVARRVNEDGGGVETLQPVFEEQRHVLHDHVSAALRGLDSSLCHPLTHEGMHDRVEALSRRRIVEDELTEFLAVDLSITHVFSAERLDDLVKTPGAR